MENKCKVTTVKELIQKLLDLPLDNEVAFEEEDDRIFCLISKLVPASKIVDISSTQQKKGRKPKYQTYAERMEHKRTYYQKYYGDTAFKYGRARWSDSEDQLILMHPEKTDLILSEVMHRSVAAIHSRRYQLRKKEAKQA